MDKRNKIILIGACVCACILIITCFFAIKNHQEIVQTDAIKFKEEYETLNGLENNEGKLNPTVNISTENPIIYESDTEILDVMKNETTLIYFGYAGCPWCRNAIEPLLSAAQEKNVNKIYYVDISSIRDEYAFNENNELIKVNLGTDSYMQILNILSDNLNSYIVKDNNSVDVDTGEKRLPAPTVVAISSGKVKSIHIATLDSQTDPYIKLNDEQSQELKNIYENMIDNLNSNTCTSNGSC